MTEQGFRAGPHEASELSASLMCADFTQLTEQLDALHRGGVTRLHLDFADGSFVRNFLIGTEIFQLLPPRSRFMREAHLMIRTPEHLLPLFAPHCDRIIFHIEASEDPLACIHQIRSLGAIPGVAINPETPIDSITALLPLVNSILVMTVNPGFAGSPFLNAAVPKIGQLKRAMSDKECDAEIIVDGGINRGTIPLLRDCGANVFVGGSTGLFRGSDLEASAKQLVLLARGQSDA
jgi:ribulose-phosphate 3-epimerase